MKKEYKKYIFPITYAFLLALVLINLKDIIRIIGHIWSVLTPLWIGIALAFTLNVPMSIIEKNLFENKSRKTRIISLVLSLVIVILLLLILFIWVIPDFINSLSYLVSQIPSLINGLNEFIQDTFKNTDLSNYIDGFKDTANVTAILSNIFKIVVDNFYGFLSNFVSFIIKLITGTILAIYFLLEKESIIGTIKSTIDCSTNKKVSKKIHRIAALANKSFHDFITYQCLECLILGIIMFIAFVIFRFPYALTIAFLTTVTAIVPIFGATIACIVGAILIGTVSIEQAIIFVIVFQIVQQIENNFIYPKIVGSHVGLPPVITILAILIGGELGGFLGMLLCIPITSVLYSLFCTKLEEKKS